MAAGWDDQMAEPKDVGLVASKVVMRVASMAG